MGYGSVAVSDWNMPVDERSAVGRGRGGGIENTLDALKSAPPGDTLREAILLLMSNLRRGSNRRFRGAITAQRSSIGA